MTKNTYTPRLNEIVFARRKDKHTNLTSNDATWYRFIVSYVDNERDYIGMESLGQCDDYEGQMSLLEYKKDPNQNEDPETEMYLGR